MANKYVKLKDGSNYLLPVMYGIDTSNVITSGSTTQLSWVATQDCWLVVDGTTNYRNDYYLDGVAVTSGGHNDEHTCAFVKKGQTVTSENAKGSYVMYGLKY